MKTCDVCGSNLIFMKFKYEDGHICKKCYEVSSRNCSQVIRHFSLDEIKNRCNTKEDTSKYDDFQVTKRVGNYILFDNKNMKICILNNRSVSKEYKSAKIYEYKDISSFKIVSSPVMTFEQLCSVEADKNSDIVIKSLSVNIKLKFQKSPCVVQVIPTPVRVKSYAFKRSFQFAKGILNELSKIVD